MINDCSDSDNNKRSKMKMTNEELQNYANQIEEAGLKRDTNPDVAGLHHYVVQTTYKKDDEDAVLDGMPEAFEACFDNENGTTGECEDVSMFYLEDCSVTDAATIVSWLKANKNWKTYIAD